MSHRVNQRQLSEITGVSQVSLWQWQKEGMPFIRAEENGVANEYDTVDVIAWMIARAVQKGEKEAEKDRLMRLQADKIQREFDLQDGVLVNVAEVEPAWMSIAGAIRQTVLAQSARLTPLLTTMAGDADAIRELLDDDAREMLTKLSNDADEINRDPQSDAPREADARAAGTDRTVGVGGETPADAGRESDPG